MFVLYAFPSGTMGTSSAKVVVYSMIGPRQARGSEKWTGGNLIILDRLTVSDDGNEACRVSCTNKDPLHPIVHQCDW